MASKPPARSWRVSRGENYRPLHAFRQPLRAEYAQVRGLGIPVEGLRPGGVGEGHPHRDAAENLYQPRSVRHFDPGFRLQLARGDPVRPIPSSPPGSGKSCNSWPKARAPCKSPTTLCVSSKTVEAHRKQIMNKLGMHSVAELTKYAIRQGLTSLDELAWQNLPCWHPFPEPRIQGNLRRESGISQM